MKEDKVLLPTLFKQSGRLIDKHIDNLLKRYAIARSQYRVMYYVNRFGEPTQTELSEVLGVSGPTLTLIVNALVKKGWLSRVDDASDKRLKRHRLTAAGQRLFERVPDPSRELDELIRQGLSRKEAADLEGLLNKTIEQLKKGGK